ncbi:swr1 complex component [Amphichorda felina]
MSEPASTDHVLPGAPHSIPNNNHDTSSTRSGLLPPVEIESSNLETENATNGRVEHESENPLVQTPESEPKPDATPKTNGHVNYGAHLNGNGDGGDDNRPAKRRRTLDATTPTSAKKGKPVSPPWKRVAADGPTSYTENGRRKSGRINTVPIEHQPPGKRRITRGALNETHDNLETNDPATPRKLSRFDSRDTGRSPRIKLRVGRSGVIPLVHPDQARKRAKIGSSFDDFWKRAGDIPVEEGGLQASEDGPVYTEEMAQRDARLITRIENEAEPGGLLSRERCSVFAPETREEPPRQWARQDHMVKAMSNFRRLMLMEHQRHHATAKRIAEACRDEWIRRQPKSAEQLEAEAREHWISRYRLVVRAMFGTWENVRAEVNRRRLEEWEAEEQRRVKAALNEAVNLSEQKLQARQAGLDSEMPSDEDRFSDLSDDGDLTDDQTSPASDEGTSEGDVEDSDIMSSSEDEEGEEGEGPEDAADEGLTQEELRAKYASLPASETDPTELGQPPGSQTGNEDIGAVEESGETSDESIDMDDDMGSSEMDEEDEDDEGDESSSGDDESGDEAGGLLGMLFGKSELKQMEVTGGGNGYTANEDTEIPDAEPNTPIPETNGVFNPEFCEDEDEMSLVQHPASIDGDASAENEIQQPLETPVAADPDAKAAVEPLTAPATSVESDMPAGTGVGEAQHLPKAADAGPEQEISIDEQKGGTPLVADAPLSPVSGKQGSVDKDTNDNKLQADIEAEETKSPAKLALPENEQSRSATPQQTTTHKTEIPFLLRGTLREYQHDGLDWLAGLYANNTNGILADEMGLGKTIQTIALLAHLACQHGVWGPHLVVVPTSVMLNWEMEFKKWCPGFKILAYYGSQEERKRKRQGWNNDDVWNVCITSYQLVLQDQQVFKRRRWHYMILDEAHNIKNFKSQRWQTLLGFNTHSRLLLTGTPLQNNLTELWSLLFFLMPAENGVGGFADLQEFHDWFHKPESQILESGREQMDDEARAIISKLHKVLRPYLLRRLKADVEKQMPGKYEHVEFCRLSKRQRELYDGFLSRADTRNTLASGNYMSIINCLMQLRKVCNHPDLFVDRPIMTSFRMQKSIAMEYQHTEKAVNRHLSETPMSVVSLGFLNLIPTQHEQLTTTMAERITQLTSNRTLMELRETQKVRAQNAYTNLDPATVESNIAYLESATRWGRFEELQHCVYLNALRRQQKPIYGKNVVDLVTVGADQRPLKSRPKIPQKIMSWFEEDSLLLRAMMPSVNQRADSLRTTIEKFSCVTPAVVTRDLEQMVLGRQAAQAFTDEDIRLSAPVHWTPWMPKEPPPDPWHEARMRLSIQFPDKRLLQYDCGKLQVLDGLLRRLQAGGHRALIFTQMTKVLDILERFLNIHGHKYLRLDGATKVEQRQILTDRFNNDPRILCFILSTRSGGLGINLTGADTVIFYDQDWNPAMDKQCQDRCHRIGQTRDVHIYRLVSEHTIEANILRKASQKQMLDDVVIQEGEFTTDTFNKVSVRDVLGEKVDFMSEGVAAADAALDRVLGGPDDGNNQRTVGRVLEQAEDREDVTAARAAEKEIQADDADFTEKPSNTVSGASTARQGTPATKSVLDGGLLDEPTDGTPLEAVEEYNAFGDKMHTVDDHMLRIMVDQLKDTKLELPKDKKKGKKKGKDTRKR